WTAGLLVGVTFALCLADWRIWVWGAPIAGYRLINLARIYRSRLPAQQLRNVSIRAFNWLAAAQVVAVVLAWIAVEYNLGMRLFNVLVGMQLLTAVVLLRATLHTWRHAGAPNNRTVTLTDNELPPASVLVPARNQTE